MGDANVPDISSSAASASGGGYAPVSVPTVSADTFDAGCEESGAQPHNTNSLPPRFQKWLEESLCQELTAADAEGILAAVEVILTCEAEGDEEGQLSAACEVLQDNGAPACALALK